MTDYAVTMTVFAFDTKAEALEFQDKLTDAFCAMPEAAPYAASSIVEELPEDEA